MEIGEKGFVGDFAETRVLVVHRFVQPCESLVSLTSVCIHISDVVRPIDSVLIDQLGQSGIRIRVIVKSGVSTLELGSDLINCFHLDSIFKFYSGNHLRQVSEAA